MKNTDHIKTLLSRFQLLIVLFAMAVALSMLEDKFLTKDNLQNILEEISTNVCLAIGMTLVILTGGIDLSVGSILAFSGVVMASFARDGIAIPRANALLEFTFHGAVIAGLLVGLGLGFFNGLVITKFKIPPFVATLGMLSMARGMTQLWTRGEPITSLGPGFELVGWGDFLRIPVIIWIVLVLVAIFTLVSRKTCFGRHLYAVGGNERAAVLSGLHVNRIKLTAYTLCGLLAAVAGLILTARLDSATVVAGETYELNAIAAVVIGGTSLSGGRGSIPGTMLGCLIIGVLNNGLFLLEVPSALQLVIKGAVILVAVAIDKIHEKAD